jgi:hypothetical protein
MMADHSKTRKFVQFLYGYSNSINGTQFVRFSNISGIRVSGFWIPTVVLNQTMQKIVVRVFHLN